MSGAGSNAALQQAAQKAYGEALRRGDSVKDALLFGMLVAESYALGAAS